MIVHGDGSKRVATCGLGGVMGSEMSKHRAVIVSGHDSKRVVVQGSNLILSSNSSKDSRVITSNYSIQRIESSPKRLIETIEASPKRTVHCCCRYLTGIMRGVLLADGLKNGIPALLDQCCHVWGSTCTSDAVHSAGKSLGVCLRPNGVVTNSVFDMSVRGWHVLVGVIDIGPSRFNPSGDLVVESIEVSLGTSIVFAGSRGGNCGSY